MKLVSYSVVGLLLAAGSVQAEVPVYRNDKLDLGVVATIDANGSHYYGDVKLVTQQDGSLRVVSAKRRPKAPVDQAQVTVFDVDGVLHASVQASGILSNPCVALEPPAVSRDDRVFTVVLAETVLDPDQVCVTIAATTPFDVSIPLPLDGLDAGEYEVRVNAVSTGFELVIPHI